jgi:hypothetical protein
MDTGASARPDPIAATALQREIEAALKRIESGLQQAGAGIASLQGPLNVMANLLLITSGGKRGIGDRELPEAGETVPDGQDRLENRGILSSEPQGHLSKVEERRGGLGEQAPPAVEEVGYGDQDRSPSGVVLDGAARERISRIEERLRSLGG